VRCLRVRDLRLESRNSPVCTVRRPGRERGAGGGALAGLSGVDLARMRRMPSSAAAAEAGARGGRADGGGWRLRLIAMRESGRRAASSEVAAAGQRRAAQDGAWMSGSRAALQAGFRLPWPPLVPFHASSVARAHRVLGGGGGGAPGTRWCGGAPVLTSVVCMLVRVPALRACSGLVYVCASAVPPRPRIASRFALCSGHVARREGGGAAHAEGAAPCRCP
jgi:hypothetical protein